MKNANWYFDFVSPFAYLHNFRLEEFSPHLNIERKPLLFAGLLKHWNTKGPAELTAKRIFTYRYVQWMAKRLDIPLRFPEHHPFNPIPLLRLCIAAGCTKKAVDSIFRCVWEDGLAGDDPDHWNTFCDAIELNVSDANELIKDQLPPPKKGFIDEYKEIIPAILKQAKNPEYKLSLIHI